MNKSDGKGIPCQYTSKCTSHPSRCPSCKRNPGAKKDYYEPLEEPWCPYPWHPWSLWPWWEDTIVNIPSVWYGASNDPGDVTMTSANTDFYQAINDGN